MKSGVYNSTSVKTYINDVKVPYQTTSEITSDYVIITCLDALDTIDTISKAIRCKDSISVVHVHDEFTIDHKFNANDYRKHQTFEVDEPSIIYHCFGNYEKRLHEIRKNEVIRRQIKESLDGLKRANNNLNITVNFLDAVKVDI